jgi:hypothetical protein
VTWCGCRRGDSSRGTKGVAGTAHWRTKRGEPQDRQRDATSPRLPGTEEPSRWCKTTRTAPVPDLAIRNRIGGNTALARSRKQIDGGAYRRIPGEEASEAGFYRPVEPARAEGGFEEEAKATGARPIGRPIARRTVGRPRRPGPAWCTAAEQSVGGHPPGRKVREDAGKANEPLPSPCRVSRTGLF